MSSFETFDKDQGVNVLNFDGSVPNQLSEITESLSPEEIDDLRRDPSQSTISKLNGNEIPNGFSIRKRLSPGEKEFAMESVRDQYEDILD